MTTDSLPPPHDQLARFTSVELHYPEGERHVSEIIHDAIRDMLEDGRDPLTWPIEHSAEELTAWIDVRTRAAPHAVRLVYHNPKEFPGYVKHALAKSRRKVLRQGEFAE